MCGCAVVKQANSLPEPALTGCYERHCIGCCEAFADNEALSQGTLRLIELKHAVSDQDINCELFGPVYLTLGEDVCVACLNECVTSQLVLRTTVTQNN